ncbi:single-stranded DNA-binding protein [Listeria booriae]|uniref:ERF family protein n=1 Tax=Listeria booriae TaxID=1552123 RepID=UPI001625E033|nr:ERF family protein [Listeria booriae]MBC2368124.1 single-stranded DNA-binding protein [Listeria booriae]
MADAPVKVENKFVAPVNIFKKLLKVRKAVPYLQKENRADAKYAYVSSGAVLSSVRDMMDDEGLLLAVEVLRHKTEVRDKAYFTELDLRYTWYAPEYPDESFSIRWYAQGVDYGGEKGVGKALTYAEKYFLLKQFNIATDTDDPDAVHERKKQNKRDRDNKENYEIIQEHVKKLAELTGSEEEKVLVATMKQLGLTNSSQFTSDYYQKAIGVLRTQLLKADSDNQDQTKVAKEQIKEPEQKNNDDVEWGA